LEDGLGRTGGGRNTGPLGSGWRVVKRGECLLSIAYQTGFLWETLWNLPENAPLKEARKDPGMLLVGDRILIPELRTKTLPRSTDARHRFVKKGEPAKLRVVVEYEDDPVPNADYVLTLDGAIRQGQTDDQGLLEETIPPDASHGLLEIADLRFELQLGALDPSSEDIGAQQRLANLGFYRGELDGIIGPMTREAIGVFQARVGLEVTQELDEDTLDRLLHRHDNLHERLAPEDEDDADPEGDAGPAGPEDGEAA
jgi:peptidoglycan hydrolase-like protein with peptidoglycan-binding domain